MHRPPGIVISNVPALLHRPSFRRQAHCRSIRPAPSCRHARVGHSAESPPVGLDERGQLGFGDRSNVERHGPVLLGRPSDRGRISPARRRPAHRTDVRETREQQHERHQEDASPSAAGEDHREQAPQNPNQLEAVSAAPRTRFAARNVRAVALQRSCRDEPAQTRRRSDGGRRSQLRHARTAVAANTSGMLGTTSAPARIHSCRFPLPQGGSHDRADPVPTALIINTSP